MPTIWSGPHARTPPQVDATLRPSHAAHGAVGSSVRLAREQPRQLSRDGRGAGGPLFRILRHHRQDQLGQRGGQLEIQLTRVGRALVPVSVRDVAVGEGE